MIEIKEVYNIFTDYYIRGTDRLAIRYTDLYILLYTNYLLHFYVILCTVRV
jgi:hypothetical protein